MKEVTKAYIAGLMDGEGCFRIEKFKTERSPIGVQYRTVVEITMCDKRTIETLAKITDRNLQKPKKLPSGRIAYKLVWRNGPAAKFISQILPYLMCKKEEAALCLFFETHISPGRGRTYRQTDKEKCEKIRKQVSDLKRYGVTRC